MSAPPRDAGDTQRGGEDSGRSIALQWFGALGAPIAWLLNLEFGYSLGHGACHGNGIWPVHLASLLALVVAALAGAAALSMWRRTGSAWPNEAGGVEQRSRMLATLGLGNTALFVALIITQWIPVFVLNPCWRT